MNMTRRSFCFCCEPCLDSFVAEMKNESFFAETNSILSPHLCFAKSNLYVIYRWAQSTSFEMGGFRTFFASKHADQVVLVSFATVKNFMRHMISKYPPLGRHRANSHLHIYYSHVPKYWLQLCTDSYFS